MARKKAKDAKGRDRGTAAGGSDLNKLYIALGVVAVIAVGVVGYTVRDRAFAGAMATEPIEVPGLDDPARLVEMAQGVSAGNQDALIEIIEFGDYQCPGCGSFATSVKPRVDLAYIQTGQARFVFYDYPLVGIHPHAFLAARAARCAGDADLYWPYHETLFRNQPRWSASASPSGMFVDFAEQVGADVDAFRELLAQRSLRRRRERQHAAG